VELFQVDEGSIVESLETRLLPREIKVALGWAVAYFTFSGCPLQIGR